VDITFTKASSPLKLNVTLSSQSVRPICPRNSRKPHVRKPGFTSRWIAFRFAETRERGCALSQPGIKLDAGVSDAIQKDQC
jgi:hypothetical protein